MKPTSPSKNNRLFYINKICTHFITDWLAVLSGFFGCDQFAVRANGALCNNAAPFS
jgi:hypothetical protein